MDSRAKSHIFKGFPPKFRSNQFSIDAKAFDFLFKFGFAHFDRSSRKIGSSLRCSKHRAMDPTDKTNKRGSREFDFHFVIKKDEETKGEDGSTKIVKSEVVASRLKVIASGGESSSGRERLMFDLQSGKLIVESEPDSAQANTAPADRQVVEEMAASGWFAREIPRQPVPMTIELRELYSNTPFVSLTNNFN